MGRIIAGRTTEDLFAREEIARRIGKASYDSLVKEFHEIQDERMMNDAKKKETNMNKKMDNFAENLNQHLSRNRTRSIYRRETFREQRKTGRPRWFEECL